MCVLWRAALRVSHKKDNTTRAPTPPKRPSVLPNLATSGPWVLLGAAYKSIVRLHGKVIVESKREQEARWFLRVNARSPTGTGRQALDPPRYRQHIYRQGMTNAPGPFVRSFVCSFVRRPPPNTCLGWCRSRCSRVVTNASFGGAVMTGDHDGVVLGQRFDGGGGGGALRDDR